jgi:dUTP pyrophosphatase
MTDRAGSFLAVAMGGSALDRESIAGLVLGTPPLVEAYLSLEEQLQPNGFDLTLREIHRLASSGRLGQALEQRELSATEALVFDRDGWVDLAAGPYLVTFNEIVNLPLDLMALGRPRSSLLRCGVSLHTAVWDAGYRGRSQALLVVFNPLGYRVQRGARLMQLVFFRLARQVSEGYQGRFLGENL